MDLPTLGNPTRPTSASSFSSRRRWRSSPGTPVFVFAWGLMGGGGEMRVAASTASAAGDDDALVRVR